MEAGGRIEVYRETLPAPVDPNADPDEVVVEGRYVAYDFV